MHNPHLLSVPIVSVLIFLSDDELPQSKKMRASTLDSVSTVSDL